jgi:WhiB family redox-sensing transcriptional regulator
VFGVWFRVSFCCVHSCCIVCVVVYDVTSIQSSSDLWDYPFPSDEWIKKAQCSGVDVSLFFPPNGVRPRKALKMCDGCSVRQECLEWALDNNVHFGVWGGLTERQRFDEKRRRKEAENPLP